MGSFTLGVFGSDAETIGNIGAEKQDPQQKIPKPTQWTKTNKTQPTKQNQQKPIKQTKRQAKY